MRINRETIELANVECAAPHLEPAMAVDLGPIRAGQPSSQQCLHRLGPADASDNGVTWYTWDKRIFTTSRTHALAEADF